jgi:hypothetical protein
MFPIMVASGAAAMGFPSLGAVPWIISAATAVVFLGALDAWDSEMPTPVSSESEDAEDA